MSSSNPKRIKELAEQFDRQWIAEHRPLIFEYLVLVDKVDRSELLNKLLKIDIAKRKSHGEVPQPAEYSQLGLQAVEIASMILSDSPSSIEPCKEFELTIQDGKLSRTKTEIDSEPSSSSDAARSEKPSSFIGPYMLLQKIGEGGMGVVWMAEQMEPVRRRVALKVIRSEHVTPASIARFEAERQAIAMMDHQNIAKIYDAGTTSTGNPYYVMELIEGTPLNRYCDAKQLNVRQRLELMIPIAKAIQHAHQKGIIHRDLKHSNILVTQYDDQPVPKVIDFGLAKSFLSECELTDKTLYTDFGKVVGTLQYMSPEQAELSGQDVDTRTDIYSLGIIIYKLMTGGTPIDDETVGSNSVMQVLQLIRHKEAATPSAKLLTMNSASKEKLARKFETPIDTIIQQVRGDIDWITLKAIEKDRNRRYESANELALDIGRFLRNEVVSATPPSLGYKLQKTYSRNRGLFVAAIACTLLLVLGIIGSSAGLVWALRERDRAAEISIEATRESKRARSAERSAFLATTTAEARLHALKIKSAWSDWRLGNVASAWRTLKSLSPKEIGWESDFLTTEFSASKKVLYGHAMRVVTVSTSADGKYFASAGFDNTVKIWNAKTKRLVRTLIVEGVPTELQFSPDSKLLACADRANRVTFWEAKNGNPGAPSLGPFREDITSIAFLGDGKRLIVGTSHLDSCGSGKNSVPINQVVPVVRILNISNGNVIAEMQGHEKEINAVDCTPDGEYVVSCSASNDSIRIWRRDGDQYVPHKTLKAHAHACLDVEVSPDGKTFASCGSDSSACMWDLDSCSLLQTLVGHDDRVTSIDFSGDGQLLASGSSDRTIRIWNLDGKELLACRGHFDEVSQVCFSADHSEIISASHDNTLRIWSSDSAPSTQVVRGHNAVIWSTTFSPDGKRVISVSEDGVIRIADTETGENIGDLINTESELMSVAHSPVSNFIVASGSNGKILIFDTNTQALIHSFVAHEDAVWDTAFSPDGKLLLTASSDGMFKVWNTSDWSLAKELKAHDGQLASARFSNNGKWIVTTADDRTVSLWDAQTFNLLKSFLGHTHAVWRAVFSPSDKMIASSSYDGEIMLWDVQNRKHLRTIKAHQSQIAGLAFSSDGNRIVSASDDKSIKFWDIKTGIELFALRDKDDSAIVSIAFSNDGTKLVSGNQDGWVTVRTAHRDDKSSQILLPQDAIQQTVDGIVHLTSPKADLATYQRELRNAKKCCKFFPSYLSYTMLGIAQYRLGEFDAAVSSLTEAQRLESLAYGAPDLPPHIEAFLSMAYWKNGQLEEAELTKNIFDKKIMSNALSDDPELKGLREEIEKTFREVELPEDI